MRISEDDHLAHIGVIRKSGRYPWMSGKAGEATLTGSFLEVTENLRGRGLSDTEIARGLGITTTQLRAARSFEGNQRKMARRQEAQKLKDKGLGSTAIATKMGLPNESSVRSLLADNKAADDKNLQTIASMLKDELDKNGGYLDVGAGVESRLGISANKLSTAVAMLEEQGYVKLPAQIPQATMQNKTTTKVLAPPGTTYRDVATNLGGIRQISAYSEDNGRSFKTPKPPLNIDPKRVEVVYSKKNAKGEEVGGGLADGVIYVRRGVDDVSLGGSTYAQVRIAVGGTHYLKGMAVYKDDLPAGVDLQFNTNKSNTGNKLDAMKKMAKNPDGSINVENPFGAQLRRQILNDDETKAVSVMNILDEEGTWGNWSKTISTQVLSKQPPMLAEQQLKMTYERKKADLDEIMSLTNPTVRAHLLDKYASAADSSAVHLKAAHLPRQATHVILPINSLKPNEIFAPRYNNGEIVALVRYPHGGKFEIPELVVNNSNREARKTIGAQAPDAVGINSKVAARLSGADFDGDTVVVFPNTKRQLRSEPALEKLKKFDAQKEYAAYDGMPTIDGGRWNAKTKSVDFEEGKKPNSRRKGTEMGYVSNLITDMTIKGANNDELARAVKHSMVVIDAEKHSLDYKKSHLDNGIRALNVKYQGRAQGGSSTLISRATSKTEVPVMAPRPAKDGGPIDPKTGQLVFVPKTFTNRFGEVASKSTRVDKLANTTNAKTLISTENTKIENVYADHSNRLKQLANDARKEVAAYKPPRVDLNAKEAYKPAVESLKNKLVIARRNKPLERQAQIFANVTIQQKLDENPMMDPADVKKIKNQALATARARTGASKTKIIPTPEEWAAIQAGAVSTNQLKQVLDNADLDAIRALATPRTRLLMTSTKISRAKGMVALGYTQAEIADALGVSVSTLEKSI